MHSANLLYQLDPLFGEVVYPGHSALADSFPNEWESALKKLHGKDWKSVRWEDFEFDGNIGETVGALSVKGFIYFLLGLIRLVLTDSDRRYSIVHALLHRFTVPEDSSYPKTEQKKILAALSSERRKFLMTFLAAMRDAESTLCPVIIDAAILSLKSSDVIPYKREEVERWASSFKA
jgi:hypothetical protein